MKIKHKESGKIIELVEGTLYPTQLYDLVDEAAEKAAEATANYYVMSGASERTRAEMLLEQASDYLRLVARNNGRDLDTMIEGDTTGLLAKNVELVVLEAVKRALTTPIDAPPADQWSQAASPYSESMTFMNLSGNLFFKDEELRLIGVVPTGTQFGILRGVR